MMLGAYLLVATSSMFAGHPLFAIVTAVIMSPTVGILVYLFLMRKMAGEMVLAAVLSTIALGIFLRGLAVLIWTAQQQYPLASSASSTSPSCCLAARAFRSAPPFWC